MTYSEEHVHKLEQHLTAIEHERDLEYEERLEWMDKYERLLAAVAHYQLTQAGIPNTIARVYLKGWDDHNGLIGLEDVYRDGTGHYTLDHTGITDDFWCFASTAAMESEGTNPSLDDLTDLF